MWAHFGAHTCVPSPSRQSDLRRIAFGALRAVPKRTSNAQDARRGPLVAGNSQEGGNDDVQRNAQSAVSNDEKATTHGLGRGH